MESLPSLPRTDLPRSVAGTGPVSADAAELSEDQVVSFANGLLAEISRVLEQVPGPNPVAAAGTPRQGVPEELVPGPERQVTDATRPDLPGATVSLAVAGAPAAPAVSTTPRPTAGEGGGRAALAAAPLLRELPRQGPARADAAAATPLPEARSEDGNDSLALRVPSRGGSFETALQSLTAAPLASQPRAAAAVEQHAAEARGTTEPQPPGNTLELQRALPSATIVRGGPLDIQQPRAFGDGLVNQVTMLIGGHASQARLAITPPELGPVDVRVTVAGDDISVQLAAAQPAAREALEAALPRLRGALQDAGLQLADSGVFEQLPQQQHGSRDESRTAAPATSRASGEADAIGVAEPSLPRVHLGLVDAFV